MCGYVQRLSPKEAGCLSEGWQLPATQQSSLLQNSGGKRMFGAREMGPGPGALRPRLRRHHGFFGLLQPLLVEVAVSFSRLLPSHLSFLEIKSWHKF